MIAACRHAINRLHLYKDAHQREVVRQDRREIYPDREISTEVRRHLALNGIIVTIDRLRLGRITGGVHRRLNVILVSNVINGLHRRLEINKIRETVVGDHHEMISDLQDDVHQSETVETFRLNLIGGLYLEAGLRHGDPRPETLIGALHHAGVPLHGAKAAPRTIDDPRTEMIDTMTNGKVEAVEVGGDEGVVEVEVGGIIMRQITVMMEIIVMVDVMMVSV